MCLNHIIFFFLCLFFVCVLLFSHFASCSLCCCIGDWKDGNISGKGKYTFASGAIYDGEWQCNKFHGRGTYVWPGVNGGGSSSYIGDWVENKMHGVGAFLASTGDRYQGVFHNDRFQNAQGHWIAPMQATNKV